jgi:hypothetical protein
LAVGATRESPEHVIGHQFAARAVELITPPRGAVCRADQRPFARGFG